MHRYQYKEVRIMKNKKNMTSPREFNKAPITTLKQWRCMNCLAKNSDNPLKEDYKNTQTTKQYSENNA